MRADNRKRRWILIIFAWAMCAALGYSGAALADYILGGAHDAQVISDVKAAYYSAAGQTEPEAGASAETGADGPDATAVNAYAGLKEINPDAAGWLAIPGTAIDYPVAQGEDNTYYLRHNFMCEQSKHACIFMDYRNRPGDVNTVLYGHNMKDGTYFGSLKSFEDRDYCAQHGIIELNLWGEATQWRIFSVRVEDDSSVPVQFGSGGEYGQYVETVKQASEFDTGVEVAGNDVILTLSTCDEGSDRLLVHAVRLKE